ncbi:hypothetical protein ACFP1H_00400 [Secundilactobacillus hailunensis]|uniref:Uncharacterized protein n=1 Tax=Secundilactobacillus hailunensis TaxID=2559923 RepID=A0ABW1T629_9LACO|nr:hypothetical protein [Secundilactobacillus hailunensis]
MRSYNIPGMITKQRVYHSRLSLRQFKHLKANSNFPDCQLTADLVSVTASLIAGYQKMSEVNAAIAQEYLSCENEVARLYLEDPQL